MKINKSNIEVFSAEIQSSLNLPLASEGIKAGFPSPAQDFMDISIDLNRELIANPASTFYARVSGDSMQDAGILDGDLLVIDKSLEPQDGDMAVCYIDGDFTLKFIRIEKETVWLIPANDNYQSIRVTGDNHFMVWGIVTYSIKKQKRKHRNNK